jgi:hypothetical protein
VGKSKKRLWDETQTERIAWDAMLDEDDGYREWSEKQDKEWQEDLAEQQEFEARWDHRQPPLEDMDNE